MTKTPRNGDLGNKTERNIWLS